MIGFYNIHDVPDYELANQRYALAQDDYSAVAVRRESMTLDRQERVLDIAVQGLDAIANVKRFCEELEATEGAAGLIAGAFAAEIRAALKGAR